MRGSQVGRAVLRQEMAVRRHAPCFIRTMRAQQSAWLSGEACDVLAPLEVGERLILGGHAAIG